MEEERNFPAASYLACLSSASQTRIKAGLLKTHSRWLSTPDTEWRSYLQEAFNVIAAELMVDAETAKMLPIVPELVADEAIRYGWVRWFLGTPERDSVHTEHYGCHWVDPDKLRHIQRAVEGPAVAWRAEYLLQYGEPVPTTDLPQTRAELKAIRAELLADYMRRAGVATKAAIYNARNSGVHKAEFYRWLTGALPAASATARNLERFLQSGELPKPRVPKSW